MIQPSRVGLGRSEFIRKEVRLMDPLERMTTVKTGQQLEHYKGGTYTFLHIGRHSETEEWYVVYTTSSGDVWIRPYDMFFENVTVNGVNRPRFQAIQKR